MAIFMSLFLFVFLVVLISVAGLRFWVRPKEAMERRREDANKRFRGEYVHTIPNPSAQPKVADQPSKSDSDSRTSQSAESQRKNPKKQQRSVSKDGGKKPNTGYRPGRRV